MAHQQGFIQDGPTLTNTYKKDDMLRRFLKWRLPASIHAEIERDLERFGERMASDVWAMAEEAEANPPRHIPYNPWGERVDDIAVSRAWKDLDRVAAEEGLIAIGYERKSGEFSRLHQFSKLYLFHPSSAFYSCPLAMTDGAARVLELQGTDAQKARTFRFLTSRDPSVFWTSGQWMTEKTGGSDVSGTETVARVENGKYRLYGDKWFTSATTAQMSMALAKVEGSDDPRGGLSLFYIELRDQNGRLQNIQINRLKDKLGNRALPTAELTLEGTPAEMIGGVGEGVKRITALLNITRLYNSVCALGAAARGVQLSKDYATKRIAFGRKLSEQPLHLQTLADIQSELDACMVLAFHVIELLGKDELGKASREESVLLRMMTPITKLYTGKKSFAIISEVLESFGGAGYIEDTGLPRLLRDAQVYSIWEGTTNVLSLDVLRAIAKESALEVFAADVKTRLSRVKSDALKSEVEVVEAGLKSLVSHFTQVVAMGHDEVQASARQLAFAIARVFSASLLLEFAQWSETHEKASPGSRSAEEVARRFCRSGLTPLLPKEDLEQERLRKIVFG